ncbi:MAG: OadG family transporter subunit [Firmicutes bacterium]|nr:OadG family transporter subunit [Bacillota bacterium]
MLTDFMPVVGAGLAESKGMLMAVVTASGILIVFLILVLLIFIFYAYGGIFQAVTASGEKKKAAKAAAEAAKAASEKSADAEPTPAAEPADGEIPGEIIAVIAAAVASMSDGKNYIVKKVKRAPVSGRSAWAASGIFENTRPF